MSDGVVIVISSDEDPDLLKLSEEKECINNTDATQSSVEKLQNNGANEISSIDLRKSSVNTTFKEKGKEKCINQSDKIYSMATKTRISSESVGAVENNFYGYDSETFRKFMSVVLPAEPDENDRARIVKKLNKYFQLADPSYIKSPEFNEVLEKGAEKILKDSVYLYFVLKDVKNCLLDNQAKFRSLKNTEDRMLSSGETSPEKPSQGNSSGSDNRKDMSREERKHRIVNKLTALLKKVDEKIKELEEFEVDFSDEEDSSYFKMQRYRERFCQVYEKLCNYTNQPLNANRVGGFRRINFSDTDNLELNRAIEKWLNKTKQFPDYSDVNKFMIELNQSLNLNLTKEQLKIRAQHIFEKIGNMLQRRRHFDLWDSLSSFLSTDVDPAVKNPELESVLQKNYDLGIKKEKELLRYYAERQEREKLEPREVPDEEANRSPTESGDEDEEEIEIAENMLDSKISMEDNEYDNENEESDYGPYFFSDSETRNQSSSKMDIDPETGVENNNPQSISVSNDNCEQIDDVGCKGIDLRVRINSEQTETVGTNIGTIPIKNEDMVGALPNKQETEDNLIVFKSENLMKWKTENLNENNDTNDDDVNIRPCKRFLEEKEMTETKNFEETGIINKSDSDSDCEIVEIISSKEGETSNALSSKRKVYRINYAFINNNFNHNTVISNNIFGKGHCFPSNYKNMKNQKSFHDFPPNELTNIKSITNKYASYRENKVKRKLKNTFNKPKSLNSVTWQTSKDSDLKNNGLAISTDTNSINCSLQQEKSAENMKSQKEVNKTNQNNDLQQGSSNQTAAPPNGGSSGGGNGQDNSENNGNKKPFDRETQTEDNQENEDKEEDEEDANTPAEKPPETPKVIDAAPKITVSRTCQKEQKVSGGAVFKLPSTEKIAPVRRNSVGKPASTDTAQIKEPLNNQPATRSSRTRPPSARKRKINQNGGIQSTPRQEICKTFTFQFKKAPAELKKPKVNKPIPTASSSKDDDIEIIQVTKKKRSTPVKSVQSDEEIVKNFLERSHPSISITTPKKKAVQKEPPPSVRQALETLSRLKGISTTIVKGSSKQNTDDEVTIIGESLNARINKISKQQKSPAPSATATTSSEPVLPKIVTVQGNVSGFEEIVDDSTIIRNDINPNYVQNCHTALANISNENASNYNENVYGAQAPVASVSGNASTYQENFHGPQAPAASTSGNASTYQENFHGPQASAASISGNASTYQENFHDPQAPAASVSGNASTYQENFTGTVECIPIPRFRNVRSRSRRTPKKTKNIEYVILD